MSIERRFLLAKLVEGDEVIARRVMPNPHRYYLSSDDEIEEFVVGRLVELKIVAPKPLDALWDRIAFVADRARLIPEALEYWPCGFGHCVECNEILGAGTSGLAPRHGGYKAAGVPPCSGSSKPLTRTQLYAAKPNTMPAEESKNVA